VLTDGRVPETIAANFHFRISLAGLWNAGNGEIAVALQAEGESTTPLDLGCASGSATNS
jgi:hypothetical protein